jgi:outer membrane murein-binding lipoprotein Lpp
MDELLKMIEKIAKHQEELRADHDALAAKVEAMGKAGGASHADADLLARVSTFLDRWDKPRT